MANAPITTTWADALGNLQLTAESIQPYHHGEKRPSALPLETRPFIAWDGEGINLDGKNKPQSYVLFGASTGDVIMSDKHIHVFELLDLILKVGNANPGAFHVGFAFNYDANMIIRSLHRTSKEALHKNGFVRLRRVDQTTYRIQFLPGKWFHITRYDSTYHPKRNHRAKTSVRIYDIFSFFGCSFIKAYEDMVGEVPQTVREGKAKRNEFDRLDMPYVESYWRVEIQMLVELANALRRNLYGAGFRVSQWHGPGALASFVLRREKIDDAMAVTPESVRTAARYAYAGGRFEIFQLGRARGSIYSVDINSAYPTAIAHLPNLVRGGWRYREGPLAAAGRVARFGVYHVRLLPSIHGTFFERRPGPLFHRDSLGNISFPWVLEGWYWSPEIMTLMRHCPPESYEIIEGWEYVNYGDERPFAFIRQMYEQRREWKRDGIASQWALKLAMNSLYGKMAQRVGWDEEKRRAPKWHQLEWAGWVTSYTRAKLWDIMAQTPYGSVLAVETDGLYLTTDPATLGIHHSSELGGWDVSSYDEIMYVQSGMAWLRSGDKWTCKRRGLDASTFALGDCNAYLKRLAPKREWVPYVGTVTRFVGIGSALNSSAPTEVRHCVWQTTTREIRPGMNGKRIHLFDQCQACSDGLTAHEATHDMSIRSLAYAKGQRLSFPHDIPWEDDERPQWRERQEEELGLVVPV